MRHIRLYKKKQSERKLSQTTLAPLPSALPLGLDWLLHCRSYKTYLQQNAFATIDRVNAHLDGLGHLADVTIPVGERNQFNEGGQGEALDLSSM
jgi:hypothetical protein